MNLMQQGEKLAWEHAQVEDLELSKRWISPVKGEDAFIVNLPSGDKLRIDGYMIEDLKIK